MRATAPFGVGCVRIVAMLDPVDVILTPVDPVRGLGAALSELSRLAELDPKLKAAQAEVGEYLQQLDQGDAPTSSARCCGYGRGRCCAARKA